MILHLVLSRIIGLSGAVFCSALFSSTAFAAPADPSGVSNLLLKARLAYEQGKREEALSFAQKAVELDPKNADAYETRGRIYDAMRQFDKAVSDYDQLLKLKPAVPKLHQLRGEAHFKLGNIRESIADFDRYIESNRALEPHHWQRGISYYYAERYEDGRKQFESHQTVNANDVENAVWHFLCVARSAGVEKARSLLIPIKGDGRVPMTQVHALFAGKATVEEVLAAAKAGEPTPEQLRQHLFYAHLLLGLYYEAIGDAKRAQEHIGKAAGEFAVFHYMGDVARVHEKLRNKPKDK